VVPKLLSGDRIGSRPLGALLLAIVLCLALTPFIFPGTRSLATAANICIFVVLVASYDMLLGYAGIVSFAHTMFFGFGAYGVGIALKELDTSWGAILLGAGGGVALSLVVAFGIGLLSLRVRAIFFAMITLAVASFVLILASQLHSVTGGEDGVTYSVPGALSPAYRPFDERILGVRVDGRLIAYYLVFVIAAALFLVMLRIVNSPFGRVLQAIRENEFRTEALGYRVVYYRTVAFCLSAGFAALAGALQAIWLKNTGPESTLSFAIMIDVLLMVVIGGMGSMYGAIIGVVLLSLAQFYLKEWMSLAAEATSAIPLLPQLLHPDRWLLWLGVLFILSVYFFPKGIVGSLRRAKS
jgi:branched-chain amino acid transport system permease protein